MSRFSPHRRRSACFSVLLTILASLLATTALAQPPTRADRDAEKGIEPSIEQAIEQSQGRERLRRIAAYLESADYDDSSRAVELGLEALEALRKAPDPHLELITTCGLCRAQIKEGLPDNARALGERCEALAKRRGAKKWLAWSQLWCFSRGHARSEQIGLAVAHGDRAIELYEKLGESADLAEALTLTAIELHDLGDLPTAIGYQQRALAIFRSLEDARGQAVTLLRLGAIYADLGQPDRSMELAKESYEAFLTAGVELGAAAALHNIATNLFERGDYQHALGLFEESVDIKRRLGQRSSAALGRISIGMVYAELGQLDRALGDLEGALDTFRDLGEERGEIFAGIELARVLQRQGERERARQTVEKALEQAERLDIEERALNGYLLLAELHEDEGDLPATIAILRRYDTVKSRLLNTSNAQRIAEMETRFQAEARAREIEELTRSQELRDSELRRNRTVLIVGFFLFLLILLLLFNRYRLRAEAERMAAEVEQEKAVSASLREVDRLKDEFLAITSHELRTPIHGVIGLVESLLDGTAGELPPAARSNLDLILHSSRRLTALVANILDSAKLRRHGLELVEEAVDLHSVADIVITLSKPLVEDRPLELRNAVPADLEPALADPDRLQQVLHNLIGNAIKFTERGTVTVEAERRGDALIVRIIDTGIGIEKDAQAKIFNLFEQADASIERVHGGTGLGLAISRQLVELHGGDLEVESEVGRGTTFSFTLPVATPAGELSREPETGVLILDADRVADEPTDEEVAPAKSVAENVTSLDVVSADGVHPDFSSFEAPDGTTPDASTERIRVRETVLGSAEGPVILAIDDEPVNLQVLENHLTSRGFRVLKASSGAEALETLDREAADLILLDIMMPHMSGYEVCRRIRQTRSREELPILFLSAKNEAPDRIAGFEEGGNDYLAKPIAKLELLQRVETHLELLTRHREQVVELKVLRGLLTICSQCKKIRSQEGDWDPLESYIDDHSEARFSHGLCPTCLSSFYSDLQAMDADADQDSSI